MKIHHTQVRYLPEEDRLLFSILTAEHQELRFLMTRRFVLIALPLFLKSAEITSKAITQPNKIAKQAILELEKKQLLSKADFSTPYSQEVKERPLGDEPLLLHSINIKPLQEGGHLLGLHDIKGKGIDMTVDNRLIHMLIKLIQDAATTANWLTEQPIESSQPIESFH